jgi:xanthine dehydrogenase YagS FAD-binding subunit
LNHPFGYHRALTLADAAAQLASQGAVAIGGGTDLLVTIEEGLVAPERVIDVRELPGSREITVNADGSVRIGGGVRIAELAAHAVIREKFAALAEAALSVGTPALRNMGTLAGNLMQRPRCWYFRRGVKCFKNGGTGCAAVQGEHQYHGIVEAGICRAVHPSDPAVALLALDARVEIALGATGANAGAKSGAAKDGASRTRNLPLADFYEGAAANPHGETTLVAGELILAVHIPAESAGGTQHWEKLMQRGAWDFALVSCAAIRRSDGAVRMAIGGVAAAPWRVPLSIEEDVASGGLDPESLDALAERAMYDAEPLPGTTYKVTMAQAVLRRAMKALSAHE